jgi:hypothetical protein
MGSTSAERLTCATPFFLPLLLVSSIAVADDLIPLINWTVPPWSSSSTAPATSAPGEQRHFVATTNADISSAGAAFVAVTPCRLIDTRNPSGPYGGPMFAAGETRSYIIPSGATAANCGSIPAAAAYSLNFTIANYSGRGNLKAYPTGTTPPGVSILNYGAGLPLGNAAIVPADPSGSINVAISMTATPGPTNVIIDINGYFLGSRRKAMTSIGSGNYQADLFAVLVPAGDATGGRVPITVHATDGTVDVVAHGACLFAAVRNAASAVISTESTSYGTINLNCLANFFNVSGLSTLPGVSVLASGFVAAGGGPFTPTKIDVQYDVINQPGSRVYLVP